MANVIFERLTDSEIDNLSQGRVITNDKDFQLNRNSKYEKNRLYPVVGGVYDSDFFGSIYTDTCNCGKTHSVDVVCQRCGSRVLPEEEKYKRYARIDLDFYYVMNTKLLGLIGLLNELPLDLSKAMDFFSFRRISNSSAPKICELCQFDWDEELQEIAVNPIITNELHSSYEGLELIIKEHFPNKLNDFRSLVNKKVLVIPAVYRMATFNPYDPVTKLSIPIISSVYQSMVYLKLQIREALANQYSEPSERVLVKALLRRYCAKFPGVLSEVMKPSKENLLRTIMSARMDNSGRAPIIGDPSLAIDEVKIPIHLAYEICKVDFINYLVDKLGITLKKAELKYKRATNDILDLFRQYAPTRRVIVNRPPSLHRYNNMCFKMYVTEDYAIHFPITSVEPFAADYDGDAVSFFLVPVHLNELCDKNASPATQLRYESSDDFIWKPNQDMLYGLTLATRIIPAEGDDKAPKYLSLDDAKADFDKQVIVYPTDHIILNGKLTSLAREIVGDIIHCSVDDLYGPEYVNAKNLPVLLSYLYQLKDFTKVYQKLIEYALEVLTLEGATVPSLKEMVSVDTSKFSERMRTLIKLSEEDPRYYLELEEEYSKFLSDTVKSLSPDLVRRIQDSGRMKMQQVTDMMNPQMTINSKGEYYVATNSLVNGLTPEDYVRHAINNRAILQMKQNLVPKSGYCNRQLIQAGQGIRMYRESNSGANPGVWIPRYRAEGRTTVDGEVLGKSNSKEMVLVKSFAVSDKEIITPDMISETNNQFADGSNIGMKITTAVAGVMTQKGLSLKHAGILKQLNDNLFLKAKEDCTVRRLTIDTIEIKGKTTYSHFIPQEFVLSNPEGVFKKGDIIGFIPRYKDPGFTIKSILDLIGALNTDDIGSNRSPKDFALCVTPVGGKIHYDMEYVHIGSLSLPRNPERIYYFFEGDYVEPYSIICDGVLDCKNISQYCPSDTDYYGCFRSYFLSLLPNNNEQSVEYLFRMINSRDMSGSLSYTGVKEKVRTDKSLITNLGYEGAARIIKGALANPDGVVEDSKEETDLFAQYYLTILNGHI